MKHPRSGVKFQVSWVRSGIIGPRLEGQEVLSEEREARVKKWGVRTGKSWVRSQESVVMGQELWVLGQKSRVMGPKSGVRRSWVRGER